MKVQYLITQFIVAFSLTACNLNVSEGYFNEANTLIDKGKFRDALPLLEKATEINSEFPEAYFSKAICYGNLSDYNQAIKNYKRVLDFDTINTAALYYIGNNYLAMEKYHDAIQFYNKALATKGFDLTSGKTDAVSLIINYNTNPIAGIGQYDIYDREIIYQRGLAYYELDSLNLAYQDFKHCLVGNYYSKECHFMIAMCFIESGEKELGCEQLEKAIALGDSASLRKKMEVCF